MESSSSEIAAVLRRLAEMLEVGRSTAVRLSDELIFIPSQADLSCKYESNEASKQLSIRVSWPVSSSTAELIHHHSHLLEDGGDSYDVFIYGERRLDGTWEGWVEFVPLTIGLSSRRTERETTQPDASALEYWATGLEPQYLVGAFERATVR